MINRFRGNPRTQPGPCRRSGCRRTSGPRAAAAGRARPAPAGDRALGPAGGRGVDRADRSARRPCCRGRRARKRSRAGAGGPGRAWGRALPWWPLEAAESAWVPRKHVCVCGLLAGGYWLGAAQRPQPRVMGGIAGRPPLVPHAPRCRRSGLCRRPHCATRRRANRHLGMQAGLPGVWARAASRDSGRRVAAGLRGAGQLLVCRTTRLGLARAGRAEDGCGERSTRQGPHPA